MVCIFHNWKDVTNELDRFRKYATVKECADCNKTSISIDKQSVKQSNEDLLTKTRVVLTMDNRVSSSVEDYPSETEIAIARKILRLVK